MATEKNTATKSTGPSQSASFNISPEVSALISWLFAPISSIIFMLIEDFKDNEFIQFNAKQSLYFSLLQIAIVPIGAVFFFIPFINILMFCIIWITHISLFIIRIVVAIKTFNGERVELPLLADWAKK